MAAGKNGGSATKGVCGSCRAGMTGAGESQVEMESVPYLITRIIDGLPWLRRKP